jgi:hypothetical protein
MKEEGTGELKRVATTGTEGTDLVATSNVQHCSESCRGTRSICFMTQNVK